MRKSLPSFEHGTYIDGHVVTRKLPRVEVKPVIGDLDLVAVDDFLLEDTVAIPQTIAPGWKVERGKAVEETSGKSAETAVSKGGITLLTDDIFYSEAKIRESGYCSSTPGPVHRFLMLTLGGVFVTDVEHCIVECPAHEKLETEIVNTFGIAVGLALLRAIPVENQSIAKSQARGRVGGALVAIEHAPRKRGLDMADDFLLEAVLVGEAGTTVSLPRLSLGLRNRSCRRPCRD